ncbi:MAG TPA: sulfotransferase [Rhizomicrobium sp.]|jgi:tetratricopeptide (TPR) repeat protein|nr:sulfotransferase [Rhizomicrobium sp.]
MDIPFVTFKLDEPWTISANCRAFTPAPAGYRNAPLGFVTLEEMKLLLDSDAVKAETRARQALEAHPDEPQALCLLGEVLLRRARYEAARSILEPLVKSQPQLARAWRALGIALARLCEREKAIAALDRAVDLAWRDNDIWYELGDLLPFGGLRPRADSVMKSSTESALAQAETLLRKQGFAAAETVLRAALEECPNDVRALKLLADAVLHNSERWRQFKPLLEQCVALAPDYAAARFRLATMLLTHGECRAALPHMEKLQESDPSNLLYRALKALALMWSMQFDRAVAEFESFIESCPHLPGLWLEYARLLHGVRSAKAAAAYKQAIKLLPGHADAYLALAYAKTCPIDDEVIALIRAQLARPDLAIEERAKLHFVLGRGLEESRRYEQAFVQFQSCNDILFEAREFGIESSAGYLSRAEVLFRPAFFRPRAGAGCLERGAIFIVGLPRSGSTLLEQILGSHPSIQALGELDCLPQIAQRLLPEPPDEPNGVYPFTLGGMDAARFRAVGWEYMAAVHQVCPNAPFFTDKLPGNFIHVGLIHLALPHAKIIDARRHPLGCCFSYFKHYFPSGHPLRLKLRDVGRHYANYVEIMSLFDDVLPGKVHRVIYEQLVGNLEREVRRLLEYLGLPFSESCLRFHESKRHVSTISADQVAKPLYDSAVEHWRHYERWLGPLKGELGYVLDAYPDVPKFFPRVQARSKRPLRLGGTNPFALVKGIRQPPFFTPAQSGVSSSSSSSSSPAAAEPFTKRRRDIKRRRMRSPAIRTSPS